MTIELKLKCADCGNELTSEVAYSGIVMVVPCYSCIRESTMKIVKEAIRQMRLDTDKNNFIP